MKQRTKLIAYIIFMIFVISGSLFLAGSAVHKNCPVCNHSLALEGLIENSSITNIKQTLNKNKKTKQS